MVGNPKEGEVFTANVARNIKVEFKISFTNAAGQEAPSSKRKRREGKMPDLAAYFLSKMLFFAKIYDILILVKEVRFVYATDNYSKTSDFS